MRPNASRLVFVFQNILSLALLHFVFGATANADASLPGEECQMAVLSTWSDSEKWAWGRICEDRIADFNKRYDVDLEAVEPDGWSSDRQISSRFLETILLHEPYKSAIRRRGVRIVGAWFDKRISLSDAAIDHTIWLEGSRFEQGLLLPRVRTKKLISLNQSTVIGTLDLRSSEIGGGLFLSNAHFNQVNLSNAKIGARTSMSSSTFSDDVNMTSIEVSGDLFMRGGSRFDDVILQFAKIGGMQSFSQSTISGELNMSGADVQGNLFLNGQFDGDVLLGRMNVGGAVSLSRAQFAGILDLSGSTIGGSVFMTESYMHDKLVATFLTVEGNFDMSNGQFQAVDLSSTQIAGQLRLGSTLNDPPNWRENSSLILRAVTAGELQDSFIEGHDSWPRLIELEGFDYKRLGGVAGGTLNHDLVARDALWFINWLARDKSYSPGPYTQLASVLRASGQKSKADDVLFAGKERERLLTDGPQWLGLTLLSYTTGYGYHYFYSLGWIALLVFVGVAFLERYGETDRHNIRFVYSLDMLLPIIKLRDLHYSIDLQSPARYYFYFHKVMGYILASFLIAGLSGLTK